MSIAENYVHPGHVRAFQEAARRWKVWILVRQSNPASRRYMGLPGYVAKRLDCKAKTAKRDVGPYKLAGLVADPTIHPNAFAGRDVSKEWRDFQPQLYKPAPGERRMYLPAGKLYTVQLDPNHKHYGCVAFTSYGLSTNLNYIFGDYDLYGIVSQADPANNVFVQESRIGQPHNRGPELFDVQHFLNKRIGIPMILHGSQEKYSPHTGEDIVIFWPDGRKVTEAKGGEEIRKLYETVFQGRQAAGKEAAAQAHRGRWRRV